MEKKNNFFKQKTKKQLNCEIKKKIPITILIFLSCGGSFHNVNKGWCEKYNQNNRTFIVSALQICFRGQGNIYNIILA